MTDYCPIACDLHDYIEIVCLYGYHIKVTLKDQKTLEGKAVDTTIGSDKREYLLIDAGERHEIELSRLNKLEVLTPDAKFREVRF